MEKSHGPAGGLDEGAGGRAETTAASAARPGFAKKDRSLKYTKILAIKLPVALRDRDGLAIRCNEAAR